MKVSWHSGLSLSSRAAVLLSAALFSSPGLHATDYIVPDPPKPPTPEEVLIRHKLADAGEAELLRYVTEHRELIDEWLPQRIQSENEKLTKEYFDTTKGKSDWRQHHAGLAAKLTERRLEDPARAVDAALRRLGQSGTPASIPALVEIAKQEKIPWARWKALASIQEIMLREPPPAAPAAGAGTQDLSLVAPLLRDLPEKQARAWAFALLPDPAATASVPAQSLGTRMWLARYAAVVVPKEAAADFREGLASPDAAQRTQAAMLLRECLGGSLPHGEPGEAMVAKLLADGAKPTRDFWEVFPKPLEQPIAFVHGFTNARTDLIWIDRSGKKTDRLSEDDVYPGVRHVLPNGVFYSRRGDGYPWSIALTDANGGVIRRFPGIQSMSGPATHGGLWCIASPGAMVTEFAADGSVLWECPAGPNYIREVAPYSGGRTLFLGTHVLECRNRRGDVLWQTDIQELDDPRKILAIAEGNFLVSCKESIGTLTQQGTYTPLYGKLNSTGWIRYHPGSEWLIEDGADQWIHVFDPVTKEVAGSFDSEGGPLEKSKFAPDHKLPE